MDQDSISTYKQPSITEDNVSTANQASLPIEILDLIVDELASDAHNDTGSLDALRTVALVSISLCKRAYKHLFSELRLIFFDSILDGLQTCVAKSRRLISRLYSLLFHGLRFPGIAMVHYIGAVQISFIFRRNVHALLNDVTALPKLAGILDCLHGADHGITSLKLAIDLSYATPTSDYPFLLSNDMNPRLYNAFISLCSSPNFTTLRLTNVSLDSQSLCGTNVQNLYLNNFSLAQLSQDTDNTHPNKAVLQPSSITLLNHETYKPNPDEPTEIFADLAGLFHPSPNIDTSLVRALVYAKLTTLTLPDRDRTTQVNLLPRLHTLRVIQTIYLTRRHMSYTTALPQFFVPLPGGTIRDLGCVHELVVETLIPDPRLFFCPGDHDEPRLEDAWAAIDTHLTSSACAPNGSGSGTSPATTVRRVHFEFFLRARSDGFPVGRDTSIAMETYKNDFITKFFPRLSSSSSDRLQVGPMFSSDVSFQRDEGFKGTHSVVECKGSEIGWW